MSASKTYLLSIEHTAAGPVVNVDHRMPREMFCVILAAAAQHYLGGDERDAPQLLEAAAAFMRDNPGAFALSRPERSLIVTPDDPDWPS